MSTSGYILTIDQGTTGTRAGLVDESGKLLWSTYQEIRQQYRYSGWVEQNPTEILESVYSTVDSLFDDLEISPSAIKAIGVTNQRETTLVWNKQTGEPISNAIVWECRRTTGICNNMKEQGLSDTVAEVTGLTIDPYFSATKIRWILDNVTGADQDAKQGKLAFGTVDSWLIWNLTNGTQHIIDTSNASRTMLFDIRTKKWSDDMLQIMDIPRSMLPEVVPSSGRLTTSGGNFFGGHPIPICGIAGDQQSALFGQCCFSPGMLKITYGTGAFLLMNTGSEIVRSKAGLLTTVAWDLNGALNYALEGGVFSAGSTVQWLRDEMGVIEQSADIEELAQSVPDNGGVYLVPGFNGLGTPYWDPEARGSIHGLTRGSNRGHLARAALESIAYQCDDVLRLISAESGQQITSIRSDGGGSGNNMLMQFQADISGVLIERSLSIETTSLGAAYLAGLGIGFWDSQNQIERLWQSRGLFLPNMNLSRRELLRHYWLKAVERSLGWAARN